MSSRSYTPTSGAKKRPFTNDDVAEFIEEIQKRRVAEGQDGFTQQDVLAMACTFGDFVSSVESLVKYPNAEQVAAFKNVCANKALVKSLDDPYIKLGLKLKDAYDQGVFPVFDMMLQYNQVNPGFQAIDDKMAKFQKDAVYYGIVMEDIRNAELKKKVMENDVSDDLIQLGRAKFQDLVNELLSIRFADYDIIPKVTDYLFTRSFASTWSQITDTVVDERADAADMFYQYISAHSLSNVMSTSKQFLREHVSVLIEPLVTQFDHLEYSETAKEELEKAIPDVQYKLVHTTNHPDNPVYIVHAIAGDSGFLVGYSSGNSEEIAQGRAAGVAIQTKAHLDRLVRNYNALKEYCTLHQDEEEAFNASVPQQQSQTQLQQPQAQQQQAGYGFQPGMHLRQNFAAQPTPQYAHVTRIEPGQPVNVNALQKATPIQTVNDDYISQADWSSVIKAPGKDESQIDKSAKEKLNHMLLDRRYASCSAEYKTQKVSNSEVQVVCYIENVPVCRAIDTNKKKAGQICAMFVLEYIDYFLSLLPPRHDK